MGHSCLSKNEKSSQVGAAAVPGPGRLRRLFCFLNNLSELRILTTFYLAKNDHQWVNFISLEVVSGNNLFIRFRSNARSTRVGSEKRRKHSPQGQIVTMKKTHEKNWKRLSDSIEDPSFQNWAQVHQALPAGLGRAERESGIFRKQSTYMHLRINSPTHQFATRHTRTHHAGERETKLFDPCRTAVRCLDSRGDSAFSSKVILTTTTDRKLSAELRPSRIYVSNESNKLSKLENSLNN